MGTMISVYAFSPYALWDDKRIAICVDNLKARPVIKNSRIFVPVCFFENIMGIAVAVDGEELHLTNEGRRISVSRSDFVRTEKGEIYLALTDVLTVLGVSAKQYGCLAVIASSEKLNELSQNPQLRDELSRETCGVYNSAVFTAEDFKSARNSWRIELCGTEETNNLNIPGMKNLLKMRDEDSEDLVSQMNKGERVPILFGDEAPTESGELKLQYDRILRMAQPYGTVGCRGYRSKKLLSNVLYALDWMYDNMYGENVLSDKSFRSYKLFDWWDWYVGAASSLMDILMIIEDGVDIERIKRYLLPVSFLRTQMCVELNAEIAMTRIVTLLPLALLTENRPLLQALYYDCQALLEEHDEGNNMRKDMCCMTHGMPYNVGYGFLNLTRVAKIVKILERSSMPFTLHKKYNLMKMARYTFAPVMYRGKTLNFMSGRIMQLDNSAAQLLDGFHYLSGLFGEDEDRELCQIICRNASPEVRERLISSYESGISIDKYRKINEGPRRMAQQPKTHIASYGWYVDAMDADEYCADEYEIGHMWYSGDSCVQFRNGNMVGLRMNSQRTPAYESTHHYNMDGWYTGDGAMYVYTPAGDDYSQEWWLCADKHFIPGTTVDKRMREKMSFEHSWRSGCEFVGGCELEEKYITASMDYEGFHNDTEYSTYDEGYGRGWPIHRCTLKAIKSYFMMDKCTVALGTKITASDGYPVCTVVENHMLTHEDEFITVNGASLKAEPMEFTRSDIRTVHIPTSGGYVFPNGGEITIKVYENEGVMFVVLAVEHGVDPENGEYAYILLPGATQQEMQDFDCNGITILANTSDIQCVCEKSSGLTGCVFRKEGTVGRITAHTPLIAMIREGDGMLAVSVSEPTQNREEFSFSVEGTTSPETCDMCINTESSDGKTEVCISCDASRGRSYFVELKLISEQ